MRSWSWAVCEVNIYVGRQKKTIRLKYCTLLRWPDRLLIVTVSDRHLWKPHLWSEIRYNNCCSCLRPANRHKHKIKSPRVKNWSQNILLIIQLPEKDTWKRGDFGFGHKLFPFVLTSLSTVSPHAGLKLSDIYRLDPGAFYNPKNPQDTHWCCQCCRLPENIHRQPLMVICKLHFIVEKGNDHSTSFHHLAITPPHLPPVLSGTYCSQRHILWMWCAPASLPLSQRNMAQRGAWDSLAGGEQTMCQAWTLSWHHPCTCGEKNVKKGRT